jgi:hypothetical protein
MKEMKWAEWAERVNEYFAEIEKLLVPDLVSCISSGGFDDVGDCCAYLDHYGWWREQEMGEIQRLVAHKCASRLRQIAQ